MLTPRAFRLVLKHLDEIDAHFAQKLTRRRPWSETALTSLLADLLDQDTQDEAGLAYGIKNLNDELAAADGVLRVEFKIETREYLPQQERWVTQSDLGLVIRYDDHFVRRDSWKQAWLLQAKRVSPSLHKVPMYTELSPFGGRDAEQHTRILKLQEAVGADFLQYLLYCPRPSNLQGEVRAKLAYLRNRALAGLIFDYADGLALRDDLLNEVTTVGASMFLTRPDQLPRTLGEVHANVFRSTLPFAWFIALHFAQPATLHRLANGMPRASVPHDFRTLRREETTPEAEELAEGIVTGTPAAVNRAIEIVGGNDDTYGVRFLPPHTLTIRVSAGDVESNPLTMDMPN